MCFSCPLVNGISAVIFACLLFCFYFHWRPCVDFAIQQWNKKLVENKLRTYLDSHCLLLHHWHRRSAIKIFCSRFFILYSLRLFSLSMSVSCLPQTNANSDAIGQHSFNFSEVTTFMHSSENTTEEENFQNKRNVQMYEKKTAKPHTMFSWKLERLADWIQDARWKRVKFPLRISAPWKKIYFWRWRTRKKQKSKMLLRTQITFHTAYFWEWAKVCPHTNEELFGKIFTQCLVFAFSL